MKEKNISTQKNKGTNPQFRAMKSLQPKTLMIKRRKISTPTFSTGAGFF